MSSGDGLTRDAQGVQCVDMSKSQMEVTEQEAVRDWWCCYCDRRVSVQPNRCAGGLIRCSRCNSSRIRAVLTPTPRPEPRCTCRHLQFDHNQINGECTRVTCPCSGWTQQ